MSNPHLVVILTLTAFVGLGLKPAYGYFRIFRKRDKISEPVRLWWHKKNPLKLALAGGAYLVGLSLIHAPNFTLEFPSFGGNSAGPGALGGALLALLPASLLGLDMKLAHPYYQSHRERNSDCTPYWRWWVKNNPLKPTLACGGYLFVMVLLYLPDFNLDFPVAKGNFTGPGTGAILLSLIPVALLSWLKKSPLKLLLAGGAYLFGLSLTLFPEFTPDIPLFNLMLNPRFLMYLFFSDTRILTGLILTVGMMLYLAMDLFRARIVFRDLRGSSRSFPTIARWWIGRNRTKLAIMGGVYLVGLLMAIIVLPMEIYSFRSGPTRYMVNVNSYFQAKKSQEAALELRKAIREEPGNAATHLALAKTLRRLNSLKEALEAARTAAQLDPKLYQAHLLQGTVALATGDNPQALLAAKAARRLQPKSPETWALLARIYTAQKNFDQAAVQFREQLKIHPENQETRMLLIDNALTRRDFIEANREAETGLNIRGSASLHLLQGSALQGLGRGADAVTALISAALLDPKSPRPHQLMGDFAAERGDYSSAGIHYEEALKRDPNNLTVMNNLACLLSDHDFDLNRAAALAGRFYQRAPKDPAAMDTMGWILSRRGNNIKALALLRRAAALAPAVAEVRYHLGAVLLNNGQTAEGKKELEAALKLSRKFDGAAKARTLLR